MTEVEDERAVVRSLADRRRLDRVHRLPVGPALVELEDGVLQLAVRGDGEARLPEEAAAEMGRRVQLELGRRRVDPLDVRALPEDVGEREERDEADEGEESS